MTYAYSCIFDAYTPFDTHVCDRLSVDLAILYTLPIYDEYMYLECYSVSEILHKIKRKKEVM